MRPSMKTLAASTGPLTAFYISYQSKSAVLWCEKRLKLEIRCCSSSANCMKANRVFYTSRWWCKWKKQQNTSIMFIVFPKAKRKLLNKETTSSVWHKTKVLIGNLGLILRVIWDIEQNVQNVYQTNIKLKSQSSQDSLRQMCICVTGFVLSYTITEQTAHINCCLLKCTFGKSGSI